MTEEAKNTIINEALRDHPEIMEQIENMPVADCEDVIRIMKLRVLTGYQGTPSMEVLKDIDNINDLYREYGQFYPLIMIYQYGRIQGIREERARRKKKPV